MRTIRIRTGLLVLLLVWLAGCTPGGGMSSSGSTTPPPGGGADTSAPTMPTGLNGVSTSTSAITISWNAAQDDVGVIGYRIYRNSLYLTTVVATSYPDSGLAAQTNYSYIVRAIDAMGNESPAPPAITVQTLATNPPTGGLSALATLANSMSPGSWAELATDNLLPTLTQSSCGATGSIFPYTEDAVWDPISRRVLFIGSDHIYIGSCPGTIGQRFIAYGEAGNNWSTLSNPSWFNPGVYHGYDHSAMDATNGIYFHFPYGDSSRPVHRYNTTTNTWLSDTPNAPNNSCCMGVEYFPEFTGSNASVAAGGVAMAGSGNVYVYRAATNSWTGALNASRLNFGDFHVVAEYNPVHKVTIFGGGENYSPYQAFSTLYKLSPNGGITSLASAPFNLRVNQSIVTVDPVSGDYLVFGPNGEFYVFDVVNNTWTLQASTPPFASPKRDSSVTTVDLTVAAPISTYGVVMFIKHIPGNSSQTRVYLYKHKAAAGGLAMPGAADEKATYLKWGWTWNTGAEPAAVTEPVSGYYVGNPDIHGDTEGDDLWSYVMQYRRSGNPVYLNRAQAWLRYFKQDYRNNVGNPDYTLAYDGGSFQYDHLYGWGLVTWYEHTAQLGAPDTAALTEAQNLAAIAEGYWNQLNNNGTPRFVAGQHRMGYYGMRQGARHLLLATRVAEATQSPRWITLRDKLIDLWLQSPDWTWDDAGHTRGMYYYGAWDTNGSIAGEGSACQYNDVAGCPYFEGARIISPFQVGILTEAFDHAYRVTGRTDLRDRMIALARYVSAYGMDNTYQYTGSRFGIVNGQKWHNYSAGCGNACTWWDPVYSTSLVNTLVRGYKYTGDTSFYSLAKHYFNRGSKGVYGSTTQRTAVDTVAQHFVDTRFATGSENFYLDYNRGELFYTYLLFENGGLVVP